jgi:hypothetical protein
MKQDEIDDPVLGEIVRRLAEAFQPLSRQDIHVDAAQAQRVVERLAASCAKCEQAEKEF